jgi:N-acetylneuraminic acid mutarotase
MKKFPKYHFILLLVTQICFAQSGYWTKVGDMPENRYGHTVNEIDGKIYIVGGVNYELSAYPRTALVYDRSSGKWTQIPLFNNKPRLYHTSCVVDGNLYVLGGNDSTGSISTMDMFDPDTGEWVSKKAMSIDRGVLACVSLDGKIYVMGGCRAIGMSVYSDLSSVEVYDTITDTWTPLADMPRKNWAHSAVAVNGKIYVFGGRADSKSAIYYASVDMYDPQTNTWATKSDMPTTKSSFTACLLDGNIFTMGGWVNSASPLYDLVEVYNPDRDEWKTENPLPVKRSILASIVLDGKIIVYGGTRTNHPLTGTSDIYECSFANTYAHDGALNRNYARPGLDTLCVTAMLANPLHHEAALSALVTNTLSAVQDSVPLYDDGLHGDGSAGDSLWGCAILAPSDEGFFDVNVRTDDITQGTFHKLPIPMSFATAGPVTLDSLGITKSGTKYRLVPFLRNNSASCTIRGAEVALTCEDSWVSTIIPIQRPISELIPGENTATSFFTVTLNPEPFPGYFNVKAEISLDGWVYWTDSTKVYVPGYVPSTVETEWNEGLPAGFTLDQNFPNPFNPTTTIAFHLPASFFVTLKVFNSAGQKVATLVDRHLTSGDHRTEWNASKVPSGIYFYRIQA